MFTGIIEDVGEVVRWEKRGGAGVLVLASGLPVAEMKLGDSIAVNGACLTITDKAVGRTDKAGGRFTLDVSPETLACTSFRGLRRGERVNLERPLRLKDRLGGHLVTGHVDGVGVAEKIQKKGKFTFFTFRVPVALEPQLVAKGSVAVDGVSLTVNDSAAGRFSIAAIPFTLKHTNLRDLGVGDRVNVETDLIGKYVERLLRRK
ncbi:MAG TPA: riboflavin synthase [Candidatus Binatia bacterium]